MDKLNVFLAIVKKQQFWLLCGVMLLVAIVCWWMSTSDLHRQFQARSSEIESSFKSASIPPDPPNQKVIDEINRRHDLLKKGVFEAWEILYREQKAKNPLPTKVLGSGFQEAFENLKPKEDLPRRYREIYQNFIKEYLPKLQAMVDVRKPKHEKSDAAARDRGGMPAAGRGRAGMGGMGGAGRSAADDTEWIGVVDWDESNYSQLVGRFEWVETPSTLGVQLAQEDLWVYEALLRVIKNVNEGAKTQANAAIKRIVSIDIGRDAVAAWKESESSVVGSKQSGPGASSPGAAAGGGGGHTGDQQLVENRYVDDKGLPLAATEAEAPYVKHPNAEFKMMPIRLSLVMDQRRLPKLLAECANSNMPIEVRRIRVLKTTGESLDLGAASGGGGPGGPGGPPAAPGGGIAAGTGHAGRSAAGGDMGRSSGSPREGQDSTSFDIPVDLHAILYIYNPPDREKLGTGAAGNNVGPTGGVPPAAPPRR